MPSFECGPLSEEAAGTVETLATVYSGYRHRIIGIIFTSAALDQGTTL